MENKNNETKRASSTNSKDSQRNSKTPRTTLKQSGKKKVSYKNIIENHRKAKRLPSSKIFNLLLSSAPNPGSLAPLTFQIMLILFQTGFIFSREFSKIYQKFVPENVLRRKSIMNEGSFFNKVSSTLDLVVLSRMLQPHFLIALLFVVLVFTVIVYITFWKFDIFLKIFEKKSEDLRSKIIKANTFIIVFSFFLTNYDIVFFALNTLSFNSFFCRWIEVETIRGVGEGGNYLDTGFSSMFLNATDRSQSVVFIKKHVAMLNDSVECKSPKFYILMIAGGALIFFNFLLKMMSSRLMKFNPSPKIYSCKYGNSDLVIDIVLCMILINKTLITVYLQDDYDKIRVVFYINFALLSIAFLFYFKTKPYYNQQYSNLRSFQILYMLGLVAVSILVRETNFDWVKRETSTIMILTLFLTILLRINNNMSSDDLIMFFKSVSELELISAKALLKAYFKISYYIKIKIEERIPEQSGKMKLSLQETKLLIYYLLERHKSNCHRKECFCQNSKIYDKKNILTESETITKSQFVYEGIMLLDELFSSFIKNPKNKNCDNDVYYAYISFLINYMGRTKKAFYLIQKKIFQTKISVNKNFSLNIEFAALLDQINNLAIENLDNGILPLNVHKNLLEVGTSKKNKKLKVLDHILYLKRIEKFKRMVYTNMEQKRDFLGMLNDSDNRKIKNIFKISREFYKQKRRVEKEFEILEGHTRNLYAPLYCLYGNYKMEICEDKDQGIKLLSKHEKIAKNLNLNQIFSLELDDFEEFGVFFINGTKSEKFHKIEYCTSNMVKWIGKQIGTKGTKIFRFLLKFFFNFF